MEFIMIIALFMISIFCFAMAMKSQAQIDERKAACRKAEDYISFDYSGTLTIKKRDADIAKIMDIAPYKKVKYGETPEKLVYTGATVGGVTTGGWHKSGGFYGREMGNSGKVELIYYYESKNKIIPTKVKKIKLSGDLLKLAQSARIKEYLDGDSFIIVREKANTNAAVAAMQLGHKDYAFNIMEEAQIAALPTYEKCSAILNWLSASSRSVG